MFASSVRWWATGVALLFTAVAAPCTADVYLSVDPPSLMVAPQAIFDVELLVSQLGDEFNGYEAVIGYNPALMSVVAEPAEDREGALMVNACALRFNDFQNDAVAGRIELSHLIICGGTTMTGPGVVYRIRFQANSTEAFGAIELLEGTRFVNGGVIVAPLILTDSLIQIGNPTPAPPALSGKTALRVAPNPFNPRTTVLLELAQPGHAQVDVFDVRGRHVRRLLDRDLVSGSHRLLWDGSDDRGRPLASGSYRVLLNLPGSQSSVALSLVR